MPVKSFRGGRPYLTELREKFQLPRPCQSPKLFLDHSVELFSILILLYYPDGAFRLVLPRIIWL